MSLVSVVIPCYNAAAWIAATLESVFAQTYNPLEVIIVDDGSTDASASIIEGFSSRGLKLVRQANRGQTAALNRGLAASTGDYIQFLDADDLLHPEKVATQVKRLASYPECVASAEWARFKTTIDEACFVTDPTWCDLDSVSWLVEAWGLGGAMMFPAMWLLPRSVADRAGPWNENLSLNNDAEYFTRVVLASSGVRFSGGARCFYRSGVIGSLSGLKTRAGWESQFLAFSLCESHLREREDSERTRRACAVVWQKIAYACYPHAPAIGNRAMARARNLHTVRVNPQGGWMFRLVAAAAGWRLARRLQRLGGRY